MAQKPVDEVTTTANDEALTPDPTEDQRSILRLEAELKTMQTKFDSLVMYMNNYIESNSARVSKIDQIAFAALFLHETPAKFELNPDVIAKGRNLVEDVLGENNRYAEELKAAQEKAQAKEEKAAAKKAKVQEARDKKKGKVKEDAKTA